ncbi:hypothetical protein KUC3_03090 [Alteromonas sp. KC3]|nr:hypothetical protein KUC3_03090 [Alteromonas sp. KC3]BCO21430.1 hypothetical protein KUC14_02990 [Alteromonas sp. KC14]
MRKRLLVIYYFHIFSIQSVQHALYVCYASSELTDRPIKHLYITRNEQYYLQKLIYIRIDYKQDKFDDVVDI